MRLIPAELPTTRRTQGAHTPIINMMEEFLAMGVSSVRVDNPPDHYRSLNGFYKSCKACVKMQQYPIRVHLYNGEVWLERCIFDQRNPVNERCAAPKPDLDVQSL